MPYLKNCALGPMAPLILLPLLLTGCGGTAAVPGSTAQAGPAHPLTSTISMIPLSGGALGAVAVSAIARRAVVLVASRVFLVDTVRARLVASPSLGFAPNAQRPALLALDEKRRRAYVASTGGPGAVPGLFAVDLISGRVLFGHPLSQRVGASLDGVAVDRHRGTLFASLSVSDAQGAGHPQIVALDSAGWVTRRVPAPFSVGALVADEARRRLLVAAPLDQELAGLDSRTLATMWRIPGPYPPQSTAYDATQGRIWLLAPGGRATILSVADGRVVATIPLNAPRLADWRQGTDLTIDARTGAAYVSWCTGVLGAGLRCGLDRLDPGRGTRATLTGPGGLLLGLDTAHDLSLILEADGTVGAWRSGATEAVARPVAVTEKIGSRPLITRSDTLQLVARAAVATPDGLLVALDTILPLHDDVTNAPTTDGLVLITLAVPPPRVSRGPLAHQAGRSRRP